MAGSADDSQSSVVVYLPAGQAKSIQPSLRAEAETLLESAGYSIEFRDSARQPADAPIVVVVQFAGDCSAPTTPTISSNPVKSGSSLASAVVQDGTVLPLSRRYRDRTIAVKVLAEGFKYEGKSYRSLSAIAREVTGTQWNGKLFFGVAKRGGR